MEQGTTPTRTRRHWVGMRIVKTALAVFICGLIGYFRNQASLNSMIAAVVCIQSSTGKTIESSVNRALGTLIGGAAGVLIVYLMDTLGVLYIELIRYLIIALMLVPLIEITLWIKKPTISAFTCVVFLCVTVSHSAGDAPALMALERLLETLIGVVAATVVDAALPNHHLATEQAQPGPDQAAEPEGQQEQEQTQENAPEKAQEKES